MPLNIDTYRNGVGGNTLYKALAHPLAGERAKELLAELEAAGPIAIFDPDATIEAFDTFYPLDRLNICELYVQRAEHLGKRFRGLTAQPVTELSASKAACLLTATFDEKKPLRDIEPYLQTGMRRISLEALKLPQELQTNPAHYLTGLNFATNFAFFRDKAGLHTRLTTAAYWNRYGARHVEVWCRLYDEAGHPLATWTEDVPQGESSIVIDSRDVRRKLNLLEFTGQLFVHIVGATGHDVVKYALDLVGDDGEVTSTHDANAWPSLSFGGLPAPAADEDVVVWIQNSHPIPIPAGEIGVQVVGRQEIIPLEEPIGPFATRALSVAELAPDAAWPAQLVLHSGQHLCRPRYEITDRAKHRRVAHVNVMRADLKPDPELVTHQDVLGKTFILPASILPTSDYDTQLLPTPMSSAQTHLPIKLSIYSREGEAVGEHRFGDVSHSDLSDFNVSSLAKRLDGDYGHVELGYDFDAGRTVDGWLHAIFRYAHRPSGYKSETSFGSHIFNTAMTYRDEPQSYSGAAPGLSTRLFLRIAPQGFETLCHLIYPVSRAWRAHSSTDLMLRDARGQEITRKTVEIPQSGSLLWRVGEMFESADLKAAGEASYVIIRDETCRLFGYHGVVGQGGSFGYDHMFGF